MIGSRTRFRLPYKIIIRNIRYNPLKARIMLNWCHQNTQLFYSSYTYDVLDSLFNEEVFCFEDPNCAIQFTLIFKE